MTEEKEIIERYRRRRPLIIARQQWMGYSGYWHYMRSHERYLDTIIMLNESGVEDLKGAKILDLGCGEGKFIRTLVDWGALEESICAIELREGAVKVAREKNPKAVIQCGSATSLPWPESHFNMIFVNTVFSSVLDNRMREDIASEIRRVLMSQGIVVWYDLFRDNPRNPDVKKVGNVEIRRLFNGFNVKLKRVTLAPPIAKRIPWILAKIGYPLLSAFPFLRTHYLGIFRK